jgi:hypothetical protein
VVGHQVADISQEGHAIAQAAVAGSPPHGPCSSPCQVSWDLWCTK